MHQLKLKLVMASIILLVLTFTSYSQAVIKTGKGFLFINNGNKDKSFTLEINGKEVKTLKSSSPLFQVDGKILQILIVPLTNFTEKSKNKTDEELLDMHKTWESNYLSEEIYKKKLMLEVEKISFGERKALFWGFSRPSKNQQFDRDYFLTTIVGNHVVGVGSSLSPKDKKADIQQFLENIMKTLKPSDKNFDIDKLADEIKVNSGEK